MLTTKAVQTLGKTLNFGSKMRFQSLNFDFSTNQFYVRTGMYFNTGLVLNLIHQIIYSGYMVTQLIFETTDKESTNYSQIFWLLLYSDGGCWFTCSSVWAYFHRYEFATFLNAISSTTLAFRKDIGIPSARNRKISEIDWMFLIIWYYDFLWKQVAFVIVLGVFTVNPSHKQFVYGSIISGRFEFPEILYFYIFELYSKSSMLYAVNIGKMGPFSLYIGSTSWAIKQIWESNRSMSFQMLSYTKYRLLSQIQANLFTEIMPIWYSAWGFMWILGVVGLLRLRKVVPVFDFITIVAVVLSGGTCLVGISHFCGNIPYGCRVLLTRKWKDELALCNKYWRKKYKCFHIFGVKNGPVRVLRHNVIYILFGTLINLIVTILVSSPELGYK